MKQLLTIFTGLLLSTNVYAQQLRPASSAEIYHELNQLKHLTNVLYLAAHPDDENTRMIGWLVNEQHVPTAYLSLTRGDGGQNILGPHLGPALGLIRTNELLAARRLDGGAGQYFTRAVDFGYSKTAEETFNHWNKDMLTGDVVWVMRQFRPDVVICRFPPNEQAGHGQHAASAILAHEAFKVAGDRDAYKDQFKYVEPWQPKRIFFNAYRFGSRNTTSEDQFKVEVGQYNSLLGMGYGELAGISRSIHRSQGAGTRSVPGVQTEYLDLVDGEPVKESMFDGIDITWGRIGREDIGKKIEGIIAAYDFKHPEKSLPALLKLYNDIKQVKDNKWKQQKLADLQEVILDAAGFMAEIHTSKADVTRGEEIEFTMNFIARSGDVKVKLQDIQCLSTDTVCYLFMPDDELISFTRKTKVPMDIPYTEPYWLGAGGQDGAHYAVPDAKLRGKAVDPAALSASMRVMVGEETFLIDVPLSYKTLDATHGDVVEPLRVVPDAWVSFTSAMYILNDDNSLDADVHIHTEKDLKNAQLIVSNPVLNHYIKGVHLAAGKDTVITMNIPAEKVTKVGMNEFDLSAMLVGENGEAYNRQQHTIKYEHLPTLRYYSSPTTKVLARSWENKTRRIAYIDGAGDRVAEILQFAGVKVDMLAEADITPQMLSKYDAVLVGIRAINVKESAPVWMPTLLRYVNDGGTLVMQYNTAHRMNTEDIGPYPLSLSRDRVTEEEAEVTVLDKNHRLLNYPNKITQADFEDWVQERGLYFADKWDERYTPLFSMHDTGEEASKGSTLYTKYGKGHYIYTSLSFFRQLPAGNSGAVRLLLNFLNVGE